MEIFFSNLVAYNQTYRQKEIRTTLNLERIARYLFDDATEIYAGSAQRRVPLHYALAIIWEIGSLLEEIHATKHNIKSRGMVKQYLLATYMAIEALLQQTPTHLT